MRNEILRKSERKKYSIDDLFEDDRFIASQLNPGEESEAYWNEMLEKGMVDRDDYAFACRFVRSVQIRPEAISDAELFNLWVDIEVSNKAAMRKKKKRASALSAVSGAVASLALIAWIATLVPGGAEDASPLFSAGAVEETGADVRLYPGSDRALTLGGREAKIVYNEESIVVNDHEISLKKEAPANKKPVFHQLLVPAGKRSTLTLAEGSRIWVNAGTRVAFPPDFDKKKREIYVDGEIYIEVSPDPERPFIVKTTEMEVEVVGTAFNLTAYGKNKAQHIVLVAGSVKALNPSRKEETLLSANEMYSLSNGVSTVQTVDVEKYVSWKNGLYYYSSERLGVIVEHLSRYYGCSIVCSGEASQMKFSGKLDLKDKLDTILQGISQTAPIAYQRKEGAYTITNK
jgi:ferric-dicitrate binding protein FerR (iron transport regulator)